MAHHGIDIFYCAPGDRDEVRCGTCGTVCQVERNCMGPTCFLDAMRKFKRLHDRFACPHHQRGLARARHDVDRRAWKRGKSERGGVDSAGY